MSKSTISTKTRAARIFLLTVPRAARPQFELSNIL